MLAFNWSSVDQCPTDKDFQFRVGSHNGKNTGSGSGSGRVGVLNYTIRYF